MGIVGKLAMCVEVPCLLHIHSLDKALIRGLGKHVQLLGTTKATLGVLGGLTFLIV